MNINKTSLKKISSELDHIILGIAEYCFEETSCKNKKYESLWTADDTSVRKIINSVKEEVKAGIATASDLEIIKTIHKKPPKDSLRFTMKDAKSHGVKSRGIGKRNKEIYIELWRFIAFFKEGFVKSYNLKNKNNKITNEDIITILNSLQKDDKDKSNFFNDKDCKDIWSQWSSYKNIFKNCDLKGEVRIILERYIKRKKINDKDKMEILKYLT